MTAEPVTDAASCPVRHDYRMESDSALAEHGPPEWAAMRERYGSVFRSDTLGDTTVWYLLRHADILTAYQRNDLFSSRVVTPHMPEGPISMIPEQLDPPEHAVYRHLLGPLFAPQRVALWEPEIRAWCRDLVAEVAPTGGCDFDRDFARIFPTGMFLRIMGTPASDARRVLSEIGFRMGGDEAVSAGAAGEQANLYGYLQRTIAECRAGKGAGVMQHLADARVDGEPLGDDVIVPMAFLLYVAGLDTVAGELGYAFRVLAADADLRHALRDDPTLIPGFVEESLRRFPVSTPARLVSEDTEFAGCPMKAGDRVVLPPGAVNTDEAEFVDASAFDPRRASNRHLTFGAGIHRCLGSHLARVEMRIAIEEWHERIPDYSLAEPASIRHRGGTVTGLTTLPLTWSSAGR